MSWLVLQGGGRRLGIRSGALVVEKGGEPIQVVRTDDIDEVHVFGDAAITPAARRMLLGRHVDAVFYTADGRHTGRLSSVRHRAGERRLAQLAAVLDPERRMSVASVIVAGKLRNQHAVLLRIQRQRRDLGLADDLAVLRVSRERAASAKDLDQLRGIEGYGARTYFHGFGLGIRNSLFQFSGRNRRPPRDPVNAVLSFLYTLLVQRTESAARGAGLEPYVGFLHDAGRGGAAVAFDLAEEWRPIVDRVVLALINRKQLAPEDFRNPAVDLSAVGLPPEDDAEGADGPPAVHLGKVGRGIVLTAWNRQLHQRVYHAGRQGRFEIAELIRLQAELLARVCEGKAERYVSFQVR